jgi:hypothetical protein
MIVEIGRRYEHIARVFRAMKSLCVAAGLTGRNAVARANELTIKEIGFDCLELVGVKAEFIPEESHLRVWIAERCEAGTQEVYAFTRDLYGDYLAWCEQRGIRPFTVGLFVKALKDCYPEIVSWRWKEKSGLYKGLKGIHLKPRQAVEA